ncbi:hypothetical protein R3P38DRAFT_3507164 [Favolaschia claudopus]|uniref:Uncharacterized protein n=1 Tax=Favolaschia claudopus TaxID=2862362 RepID=A0AAW0BXG3_9AGAR
MASSQRLFASPSFVLVLIAQQLSRVSGSTRQGFHRKPQGYKFSTSRPQRRNQDRKSRFKLQDSARQGYKLQDLKSRLQDARSASTSRSQDSLNASKLQPQGLNPRLQTRVNASSRVSEAGASTLQLQRRKSHFKGPSTLQDGLGSTKIARISRIQSSKRQKYCEKTIARYPKQSERCVWEGKREDRETERHEFILSMGLLAATLYAARGEARRRLVKAQSLASCL